MRCCWVLLRSIALMFDSVTLESGLGVLVLATPRRDHFFGPEIQTVAAVLTKVLHE